ncbi:UDP-N-acetylmuramoyl-L-alanyl-D-glutamate--2,6-diaminopimelate ligase [Corynebacterium sp. 335C]
MTTTLGRLASGCGGSVVPASAGDVPVDGIEINAGQVSAGGVFAAVPGTRAHGARYASQSEGAAVLTDHAGLEILRADAAEAGREVPPVLLVDDVRAVLGHVAAEIHGHPSQELTVIGVTGTSGKTTTTYLLEGALHAAGHVVGLIGTTGTRIGGRPVPSSLTTPEAPALQRLFRQMVAEGATHVVMEVSSHALSLGRVDGVDFDVTCFLNLSQDHLDFHDTLDEYFDAKARLFRPESPLRAPRAVVCVDDRWGRRMAEVAAAPDVQVDTVATADNARNDEGERDDAPIAATWTAAAAEVADNGVQTAELTGPDGAVALRVGLPGSFNVANAAVAWAALAAAGAATPEALEGLAGVAVPGRMERVDRGQDFLAVVDYAHKPAAIGAVLATLRGQTSGRVIAVVGAGGDRDAGKRPIMGAEAARAADVVIVTDDNPRSEDPALIREAVAAGAEEEAARLRDAGRPAPAISVVGGRAAAIDAAVAAAGTGDAIIVCGKGHETGQEVDGVIHHFDDREELARALDARGAGDDGKETQQ